MIVERTHHSKSDARSTLGFNVVNYMHEIYKGGLTMIRLAMNMP